MRAASTLAFLGRVAQPDSGKNGQKSGCKKTQNRVVVEESGFQTRPRLGFSLLQRSAARPPTCSPTSHCLWLCDSQRCPSDRVTGPGGRSLIQVLRWRYLGDANDVHDQVTLRKGDCPRCSGWAWPNQLKGFRSWAQAVCRRSNSACGERPLPTPEGSGPSQQPCHGFQTCLANARTRNKSLIADKGLQ